MRSTANWLSLFLTGEKAFKRPLARHTFLEELRMAMVASEQPESVDGLGLQGGAGRRKRKRSSTEVQVLDIRVPQAPGSQEMVALRGYRKAGDLFLRMCPESLCWLQGYCAQEERRPAKRAIPNEDPQVSLAKRVFFSRTEDAWVCRGSTGRKLFVVARTGADGQPLDAGTYRMKLEAQKRAAELWLASSSASSDSPGRTDSPGEMRDPAAIVSRGDSSLGGRDFPGDSVPENVVQGEGLDDRF